MTRFSERHEAYYRSTCDQTVHFPPVDSGEPLSLHFVKNEMVNVEYSYKVGSRNPSSDYAPTLQ